MVRRAAGDPAPAPAAPRRRAIIAEADAAPAGYAYAEVVREPETPLRYAREIVTLHHLSVRPDFRRHGVGCALVDAVRSSARERGIATVTLSVWTFNERARAFFRDCGFAPFNERVWSR